MPLDYHTIEFPLRPDPPPMSIDFLPYGTRTLKIRLTNSDGVAGRLVLRSRHVPPGFGASVFYTHEDKTSDFRVSWGGGHELGACLLGRDKEKEVGSKKIRLPFEECAPLPGDSASYVYLNVSHLSGAFDRPRTLSLVVLPEDAPHADPLFTLPLRLEAPKVLDPARLLPAGERSYTFTGQHIPVYLSRWWSPAQVKYSQTAPPLPHLRLQMAGENLTITMATRPGQRPADYRPVALLRDSVKFQDVGGSRAFSAEFYHFTGRYFVIRLWFFWLWKSGLATWGNEIPDAERFDLVIDSQALAVVYAATDTHWREAWTAAPPSGEPLEAQIGLFSSNVLASQSSLRRKKRDQYLDWMINHHAAGGPATRPHVPAEVVRRVLEEGSIPAEDLGPGLEAHVPYFVNCPAPEGENFISSDPREG
ncbi:MAG: hypothetical protein L0332_27460 [Chloroflexi bacterium]|nr:hypothetical protein [Chloroflexota bacterium]MCI0577178.1 hypothetical protein [Chloroflexota bacterium]MCI0649254.1 hypothetical protein [Chloroflexota bacterium]MCI0730436.1 hypothetical protein [Chloroflexota bacterium]